jgi:uncharacterized protein DUF6916
MIDPATFREHVGTIFIVDEGDRAIALRLSEVTDEGVSNGMRQFSLFFHGPGDPLLSERIHTLAHDTLGRLEIFIVPVVGSTASRALYQACFSMPA